MSNVTWDSIPEPQQAKESKFFKFKAGKNRIRIASPLMHYQKDWPTSGIQDVYIALVLDIDDEMKPKWCQMKKAILQVLKAYAEDCCAPEGADATAFCVTRTGEGMESRYTVIAGAKPVPFPEDLDLQAEIEELETFVEKQNAKFMTAPPDESVGEL